MAPETLLTPTKQFLLDRWKTIIAQHPEFFEDYPERVETDAFGNILITSPPEPIHQKRSLRIATLLENLLPGDGAITECAVFTDEGVKIPDVIWLSPSRTAEMSQNEPFSPAPEICIEIRSRSNALKELYAKRDAYLRAGAKEVWFCDGENRISFYSIDGKLESSHICPDFPTIIQLYKA